MIRLLIADDYPTNRLALRLYLESIKLGLKVVGEAEDGLQAVEMGKEFKPDAIILDIAMPRMDGLQAARRLRERFPECVIITFSGRSEPDIAQRALAAGANAHYSKPLEFSVLVDTLLQLLGQDQPGVSLAVAGSG